MTEIGVSNLNLLLIPSMILRRTLILLLFLLIFSCSRSPEHMLTFSDSIFNFIVPVEKDGTISGEFNSEQVLFDTKNKGSFEVILKKLRKEFAIQDIEATKTCEKSGDQSDIVASSRDTKGFRDKWKIRGQELKTELLKIDPSGRNSSAFYQIMNIIRYLSDGLPGAISLRCSKDAIYNESKKAVERRLWLIEQYFTGLKAIQQ
jgi:hypothetical protein